MKAVDAQSSRWRWRSSATGKGRIDALDGLRALAVLVIMGFHFGVGWLQGGYIGVDVFYVLSGYLITGLLLGEYAKREKINLPAFWLRRARRLLPALLVVLVVVTLFVRFAQPAGLYPDFRMDALSALFYFSNWWQIAASGNYFVATGAVSPLTHTWSLAVEEQFYLVWPLVVIGVLHFSRTVTRGLRVLLAISALGALGSVVEMLFLYSPTANITRLYFGTDTHAQSVLVGATLACVMTMVQRRRSLPGMAPEARSAPAQIVLTLVGLAGLGGTLVLTFSMQGTSPFAYRGGFFLAALSAAALITGAVTARSGPIGRVFSLKPLVWIGTISYGVYLWHYPVAIGLDAVRTGLTGFPLLLVRFAATFVIAAASFVLVERPVMEGTFWRSVKATVPVAAVLAATVVIVVGGTVAPAPPTAAEAVPLTVGPPGSSGPRVRAILFGDSVAFTLGYAYTLATGLSYTLATRRIYPVGLQGQTVFGCGILLSQEVSEHDSPEPPVPYCRQGTPPKEQWPAVWQERMDQVRPQVTVLLVGRWEDGEAMIDGRWMHIGEPRFDASLRSDLEQAVRIGTSDGALMILEDPPCFDTGEQPNGDPWPEDSTTRLHEFDAMLRQVAAEHPLTVEEGDLGDRMCPGGRFASVVDGVRIRQADGAHISETVPAGRWIAGAMEPEIEAAGQLQEQGRNFGSAAPAVR